MRIAREFVFGATVVATLALGACEREPSAPPPSERSATERHHDDHEHAHAEEHGHDHSDGAKRDLGAAAIGGFEVHAARYGPLTPGAEIDVDIRLSGAAAKPAAVRVWIGSEDARGSLKARAEAENDHYHAHVEVPEGVTPDARLWVEVESAGGERPTGSFPLGE